MKKRVTLLFVIIITLFSFSSSAQQRKSLQATITLSVKDSLTGSPLEFLTATLTKVEKSGAKEIFTYAISDSLGRLQFNLIPPSKYEISLQYMGYFMKVIELAVDGVELIKGHTLIELGEYKLVQNAVELEAAIVKDQVVPIKYLGDTIQYNAAAFNLSDSDLLEDFFRKLPGWSVDKDGRITANGKVIEQITVNGRVFFFKDPVFVSRNLPASILENIKLFEAQSDKAKFTGIDDGTRTNTVDVAIKEEMLKGWLGNLSAGAGSDKRYKADNFIANFNKYNQIAIIGSGSNLNEHSALTFLNLPSGITNSYNLGVNINHLNKKNNFEADISYKLNGKSTINENEVHRVNFIEDSLFVYDKSSKNRNSSLSHDIYASLKWNRKSSMLTVTPRVVIAHANFADSTSYTTSGGLSGATLNSGESSNRGKKSNDKFLTNFQYIRKTKKRYRTLSMSGSLSVGKQGSEGRNLIVGRSDQEYYTNNQSFDIMGTLSYTEPLAKKFIVGSNYTLSSSQYSQDRENYNLDNSGNYTQLDPLYSLNSNNFELKQKIELYLQKPRRGDSDYFSIGASLLPAYLKREANGQADYNKWFLNLSPKAEYRLYTSRKLHLLTKYVGNVRTPSISLMMPLPDNTNPLYIREGNSQLKSEYEHNFTLTLRHFDKTSGVTWSNNASYFNNRILNMSWFDAEGVQYSKPYNYSGDYFVSSILTFELPIFKGRITLSNSLRAGHYNNISFVNGVQNSSKRDVVGEKLKLSFRHYDLYIDASTSFNLEHSTNSLMPNMKMNTWRNTVDGYLSYLFPYDIELKSDISYQFFRGYTTQFDTPYLLWNFKVSKPIIRNKLSFSFSANDILNQNRNINRVVTDFYIEETRFNTVRQYFLFSLTYRFVKGGTSGAFRARARSVEQKQQPIIPIPTTVNTF